jgi:ABC-type nickel/cobalt efflux system permease component RcnA
MLNTNVLAFNDISFDNGIYATINNQNIKNKVLKEISKYQQLLNAKITQVIKKVKTGKDYTALLWGALLCFAYGVLHALGPGHSKSIIASYFIANEEKLSKVPIMAFQISMTHVITPILLVLLADISLRNVIQDPDSQLYWFKFVSYLLIIVIGLVLMIIKFKNLKQPCEHKNDLNVRKNKSMILAISAGLVPCIGSLLILLFTMANKIFFAGVILVLFIGIGIGVTITIVGIITFYCKQFIQKRNKDCNNSKTISFIELTATSFIIVLGLVMFIDLIRNSHSL